MYRIRQGLDLPIAGEPRQTVEETVATAQVALVGEDYVGMKPTMQVQEGDRVRIGDVLFTDKKAEGVRYTSPAAGTVASVNRGDKRVFLSMVIDRDDVAPEEEESVEFASYGNEDLTTLSREAVRDLLVESGLWTAFRTRPFSKVPTIDSEPHSLFVTAMDTRPLAADPAVVLEERGRDFTFGLQIVRHLTSGSVHLCRASGKVLQGEEIDGIAVQEFDGPHPAGLPGTHISKVDPVGAAKTVWHVGYQDVVAIGRLFTTGKLDVTRVVSVGGPSVTSPSLVRTRLGASLPQLLDGRVEGSDNRIVSGSVLGGRRAAAPCDFLGRFHDQVTVLPEGGEREFLGWQGPGFERFSVKRIFASALSAGKKFRFSTSTEGSRRAMVPVGSYEQVLPLDIEPNFLLRALTVKDTEQAQLLGALELDEEDLALCTYVCPGKYDYGKLLRENLTIIEKEG